MSNCTSHKQQQEENKNSSLTIYSMKEKHTIGIGTSSYASPEQKSSSNYGPASDIFSLGLIFLELFNFFQTLHERSDAFFMLQHKRKLELRLLQTCNTEQQQQQKGSDGTNYFSDKPSIQFNWIKDLIIQMTHQDANKRPTAKEVLHVLKKHSSSSSFAVSAENNNNNDNTDDNEKLRKELEMLKLQVKQSQDTIQSQNQLIREKDDIIQNLKQQKQPQKFSSNTT
eukprot:CAMPEP_0178979436 /NCGR_PEP_ID=MMETSP0789-20121207/25839_1 /TAXON_ID=3005 /ORGANISM="Rhizosolenia setigera, Strain CCMP 1694" /LENGTH=225 /DNA_ID=CAMNT_0020669537 /DNA_START=695 /DNA_END=1368 /DNA_ORIENTATION=-